MNRFVYGLIATALAGTLAVMAQPPGGRGGPPGGQPGMGGPQGGPPPNPVLEVLDVDGNHEISSREIKGAAVSLKKLDRNRDGKLTEDEVRPGEGSGHGRPGGGNQDGGNSGRRGPGGDGPPSAEQFVAHAMTFDADKDGMLNQRELVKMAEALMQEMGNRGGGPGHPGEGGGPLGGGGRPRPETE